MSCLVCGQNAFDRIDITIPGVPRVYLKSSRGEVDLSFCTICGTVKADVPFPSTTRAALLEDRYKKILERNSGLSTDP